MRRLSGARVASVVCGVLAPVAASAEVELVSKKVDVIAWTAVGFEEGSLDLARLTVLPSVRARIGETWLADAALRADIADDRTGLGTVATYSPASKPFLASPDARIEIDKATLTHRSALGTLILGKQTIPWGVLDGLQVTDRFDAIRRRDFVLTDVRPERISRWGVRGWHDVGTFKVEAGALLDPTVSQQAREGDVFEVRAPRFRGGLAASVDAPPTVITERDRYLEDATYGVRVSKSVGTGEASLLVIDGPDTDPTLRSTTEDGAPRVELFYPRRTLIGATFELSAGPAVVRLEAAHIPEQPVNTKTASLLSSTDRPRTLAGVGIDWDAPRQIFLNAQIGADHVEEGSEDLVRPETDVIGTLRMQRRFENDTWTAKTELIGSLTDGDGAFRPSLEHRLNDNVSVAGGVDLVFGDEEDQFGQFRDASRAWFRLSFSM